ncbi:aspartate aminotransferase family protein [Anaeromassilibacillus senegalensis]|uniref:aspartate aminotransferase family protein n=1 Tax=Anaeromassilibacillus senegalensis TaxID=1673717 RepID=UPI00067F97CE|nr:aspartate aminotransferase family protein [Anaeromassilibacillus senegalensis]
MHFDTVKQQEQAYLMPTYGRFPAALVSGKGATAVDTEGKTYIDFTAGIGVNALGYCDPDWTKAVAEQAATLQHISNLYYSPVMTQLAERLCKASGFSRVFFGNSGAEANECAIKLARKYGTQTRGEACNQIITLNNSFHGRTVTTLAATGQDAFHQHFTPFTEGFSYADTNMESVRATANAATCAVLIELVQGEGGVCPLEPAFVQELAAFCKERDILLMVDEVQTGIGRTGKLFCFEHYAIQPDVVTSAKGLGGGLPIGACLCTERLGNVMNAGMHGSTFGGNPVVCAGALAVLDKVLRPGFLEDVVEKGAYLRGRLEAMDAIEEVRGMGMMLGAVLKKDNAKAVAAACVPNGLLVLTAKTLLRFLPPLTITKEEIDQGLAILQRTISDL